MFPQVGFAGSTGAALSATRPLLLLVPFVASRYAVQRRSANTDSFKPAMARGRYLPPYSPDLNPIEMAFAKLKVHLRKSAGGWIAISALLEMRHGGHGHSHSHGHDHGPSNGVHGPELQRIDTGIGHAPLELSIFEDGMPPYFRLTGAQDDTVTVTTKRDDGSLQDFVMVKGAAYWESAEEIPEPHQFAVAIRTEHDGHAHNYETEFIEHAHGGGDHDHDGKKRVSTRTALLLILGSSPMVEGIPAFFAAGKYGIGLIVVMSLVFGLTTIATYVLLCVYSTAGLQRVSLGPLERYGEVLSGVFITLVGVAFWTWPVL